MPTKPLGRRVEIKRPVKRLLVFVCSQHIWPTVRDYLVRCHNNSHQPVFLSFCPVLGLSLLLCACPKTALPMKICPSRPILRVIAHPRGVDLGVTQLVPLMFVL
jgi:hypothetical protein